jgi:hypothetical protein
MESSTIKKVNVVALELITKSYLWIDDTRHFAPRLRMDAQTMDADCGDWASRC